MANELEELGKIATAKVGQNSTLEEIEKAVGINKAIAETTKATVESKNTRANIDLEWFKALPALAVPIVSLLTLFGTIWIQGLQLQASRQQDEDKQWRAFLHDVKQSVKGSPNQIISDPTFAPQLKSFLSSSVYKSQAVDLAKRMIGSLANKAAFDDILDIAFPDKDAASTADIADIDRSISRNLSSQSIVSFFKSKS